MASGERESVFGPDDLRAHLEAGHLKRGLLLSGVQPCVPDVATVHREERPGLPPVGAVVVLDLAELLPAVVDAGLRPPAGSYCTP
jgi:hypothetical protein